MSDLPSLVKYTAYAVLSWDRDSYARLSELFTSLDFPEYSLQNSAHYY